MQNLEIHIIMLFIIIVIVVDRAAGDQTAKEVKFNPKPKIHISHKIHVKKAEMFHRFYLIKWFKDVIFPQMTNFRFFQTEGVCR